MARTNKLVICLSMCLISIVAEGCASIKLETNTLVSLETDTLGWSVISLTLEKPYHIQTIRGAEGKASIFSFPDEACIILTDAALFEFPPDEYIPDYIRYNERITTQGGTINNRSWRIDIIKSSIKIYYFNVLENNKLKYDTILDNIQIKDVYLRPTYGDSLSTTSGEQCALSLW